MELSSIIFFLYFRKEYPSSKNKKSRSEKNSYVETETELSYIFSKKFLLYFWEWKFVASRIKKFRR